MSIFKNKHIIVAMLVAPVLAIIAYFATDHIVSEKPHKVQQGQAYKLAANPNCRYPSGQCTLRNGDIEINVRLERISDATLKLVLKSSTPIQQALASFATESTEPQPTTLYRSAVDVDTWNAEFRQTGIENSTMRLVVEISGSKFYAETAAVFIDYETTFSRENFTK